MASKQVKVDNWGIFFLQQLKHFFNKTYFCDLTLQFDDNVQLKVHRLVLNACTEYFNMLEQTCEMINDCLIMPPDLQADVVVPIVNFMYTGILEFQESIYNRLYTAAKLMSMSVLTKLLDAQKVPISPIIKPINKKTMQPVTWNLQGKKITPKTMDPDLPEQLPGRKLPIWKRKSVPSPVTYRATEILKSTSEPTSKYDDTPKPSRFEWPEDEESSFDTVPFDEISYTSKPLQFSTRDKSPKPSTSNFEELKRSSTGLKHKAASPLPYDSKRMNIQDVKEYLKEQKLRSDYNDYDDAEAQDNDLQTYNDDDSAEENDKDVGSDPIEDEASNKSILKHDTPSSHNKRVRFNIDSKENAEAGKVTAPKVSSSTPLKPQIPLDMSNHTKIITEVLKKYPHLVKKNKNIRLKILAKGSNAASNPNMKPLGIPVKVAKPTAKVSYMVMKPEQKQGTSPPTAESVEKSWTCTKCTIPKQFDLYHTYRNHLTEIHQEKMDSQMCNICGHTSRKQNMLMYHKFVKHSIPPPPIYQFPKCQECPYIALSPNLLLKHQYHHMHMNLICRVCMTRFQTKSALASHIQLTGHVDDSSTDVNECSYCAKKFTTDETLFQHIKKNHTAEARRDNLISQEEDVEDQQETVVLAPEKPKEKIKILSNIKVNKQTLKTNQLMPVKDDITLTAEHVQEIEETQPSSEAESLSNVASGIAASLGLVNTIVVLEDNQYILQSQDDQENMASTSQSEYIIPDVTTLENLPNIHVSQHQMVSTANSTMITQAGLGRDNIGSTDELVMVLTDHDYSDATNNTVMTTENSNIVVLYSHPVQNQDGQYITQQGDLMLNADMGMMEVGDTYSTEPIVDKCEESIEMIQQEINNHLEEETQEVKIVEHEILEEKNITLTDIKSDSLEEPLIENDDNTETPSEILISQDQEMDLEQVQENDVNEIAFENQIEENKDILVLAEPEHILKSTEDQYEEPMEIEESVELIQEELNKNEQFESEKEAVETANSTDEIVFAGSNENETIDEHEIEEPSQSGVDETGTKIDIIEKEEDIILEEECMEVDSSNLNGDSVGQTAETLVEEISIDNNEVVPDSEEEKNVDECDNQQLERSEDTNALIQDSENEIQQNIDQNIETIEQIEENADNVNQIEDIFDHTKMAENIEHSEENIDKIEETIENSEENINNIEENINNIEENINNIEENVNQYQLKNDVHLGENRENLDQIEETLNHMEENVEHIEDEVDRIEENIEETNTKELGSEQVDEIAEPINDQIEETKINNVILQENTDLIEENKNSTIENIDSVPTENETVSTIEENAVLKENTDVQKENMQDSENQESNSINEDISEKIVKGVNITPSQSFEMEMQSEVMLPEIIKNTEEINKTAEETLSKITDDNSSEVNTEENELCSPNLVANNTNGVEMFNKSDVPLTNPRISNLLDDWDDGDTDSVQSDTAKPAVIDTKSSINTLINDWEDDEST